MEKLRVGKLAWAAAVCLVVLSLGTTPARADHDHDIVLPMVTGFALGALWSHGHGDRYYSHGYRYKRHGHHRGGHYRHGHHRGGHHRYGHSHKRPYSYSRGGYANGYGHKRHYGPGRSDYGHSRGHGSKRGGHGGKKHKH
jgi:hypothetical protein